MSYDLVVWVGDRPADADEADELYEQLMDRMEEQLDEEGDDTPPNPRLVAYAAELTERWPDDVDTGPWVLSPLIDDAVGDVFPFGIMFEHAEEVASYAAGLAVKHGLVCYDPQEGGIRP